MRPWNSGKHPESPIPKKAKFERSGGKVIGLLFLECKGSSPCGLMERVMLLQGGHLCSEVATQENLEDLGS